MTSTRSRTPLILAAVAVVAVAVLAAVLGFVAVGGDDDEAKDVTPAAPPLRVIDLTTLPAAARPDGVIRVGRTEAPVTVTVFEDFRCPFCARFENDFGMLLADYADAGKINVDYHIASFLDRNLGGTGSAKAANAARCSLDAGRFPAYHSVLFHNQPEESQDGFTDERLLELAGQVPGLRGETFDACVRSNAHGEWVTGSQTAFDGSGVSSTPSLAIDGQLLPNGSPALRSPDTLRGLLDERLSDPRSGKTALGEEPRVPSAG